MKEFVVEDKHFAVAEAMTGVMNSFDPHLCLMAFLMKMETEVPGLCDMLIEAVKQWADEQDDTAEEDD